jgi:hypothetical protein
MSDSDRTLLTPTDSSGSGKPAGSDSIWRAEIAALNRAVALTEGYTHHGAVGFNLASDGSPWCHSGSNDWWKDPTGAWVCGPCYGIPKNYAEDDAEALRLMEKHKMHCQPIWEKGDGSWWRVFSMNSRPQHHKGPTLAIAICRAAARLESAPASVPATAAVEGSQETGCTNKPDPDAADAAGGRP